MTRRADPYKINRVREPHQRVVLELLVSLVEQIDGYGAEHGFNSRKSTILAMIERRLSEEGK